MNQYHPEDDQEEAARYQEMVDHIRSLTTSLEAVLDSFDRCPTEVDWQFWVEAHELLGRRVSQ
jgi:hypothetical protein